MGRKLLIVDDEAMIRQGIKARLDYLNYTFDTVREAEDGRQALDLLEQETADIVITDIQMTDMDGIALIRQAKSLYPLTQFIILSGYAEFAYAEQAIRLGVVDYLLKPISNDSLVKAMENTLNRIRTTEVQKDALRKGNRVLEENKAYVFEKDLNALLYQTEPLRNEGLLLQEKVEKIFPLADRRVLIALIHIDTESYERNQFSYEDMDLVRFSIRNIFDEITISGDKAIVNNLTNHNQMYAILSNQTDTAVRFDAEQVFSVLLGILWNRMNLSVSVGISAVRDCISQKGTKEAQDAFMQRILHGSDSIYFYDDIKVLAATEFTTAEFTQLGQYIERGDVVSIETMLNMIFSDERMKQYNAAYLRIMWVRIIGLLFRTASGTFEKEPSKAEQLVADLEDVVEMGSLAEIRAYLYTAILDCIEPENTLDTNAKNKMKLAAKYITDHYNKDISINDLAERFLMSPNYFSSIFKKEIGKSTVNYIKDLRLEKAKEYLQHSEKSVVDIAKEVGYEDSQYFFKVFKKATGQTPSQFRKGGGGVNG